MELTSVLYLSALMISTVAQRGWVRWLAPSVLDSSREGGQLTGALVLIVYDMLGTLVRRADKAY